MDDSKIAKRTEQIIKERGYDPEWANSLAKDESITEETSNYIAKIWQHLKGDLKGAIEISATGTGIAASLAASPGVLTAVSAFIGFGTYLWGRENNINALKKLAQKLQKSGASLEESPLNLDECRELFLQFMEISSKSSFEEKQNYLVNLFINSVVSSKIPFSGKQALFRLHSQISVEEIQVLKVIYDATIELYTQQSLPNVPVTNVADKLGKLGWKEEDAYVTCEALAQMMLVIDGNIGTYSHWGNEHQVWRITALGNRFIKWVTEELPLENLAEANTPDATDIDEKNAWSQLTTEQFFSGYSEADAIYDNL